LATSHFLIPVTAGLTLYEYWESFPQFFRKRHQAVDKKN